MDLSALLVPPPAYDTLIDAYRLDILRGGGDLQVENGDLAVTKDGDLRLGDHVHNGLFRLVQRWRYTAPQIGALLALVAGMQDRIAVLLPRWSSLPFPRTDTGMADWHAARDESSAAEHGQGTYAACVVLLVSGMLLRFKNDLGAGDGEWRGAAPYGGHSAGEVIIAAANGVRHDDEWWKTRVPTAQQRRSQAVLDAALGPRGTMLTRHPGRSPEVLSLLAAGGGLDGLTACVLGFAHDVGLRRRTMLAVSRTAPSSPVP